MSLTLPDIEKHSMADQMRRSSKSIPANLAEGFGKRASHKEFCRYVYITIGSADEMRVWLRYCRDLGYIEERQWQDWRQEYQEIVKMLVELGKRLNQAN
ncbi:MAG: four helix bundle protein [Pseudomonadota bacterium]